MSAGGLYFLSSFVADDGFYFSIHEYVTKAEDAVFGARFKGAAWVRVVLDEVYSGVKEDNQFDELLCVNGGVVEVFYQAVFKCNAFFCFLAVYF